MAETEQRCGTCWLWSKREKTCASVSRFGTQALVDPPSTTAESNRDCPCWQPKDGEQ